MSSYQTFIFENYSFDSGTKTLHLHYSLDNTQHFTETYRFDFEFSDCNPLALDRALQQLFFVAGVSYYKLYLPGEIEIHAGEIDQPMSSFLEQTYQKGLGEFFYVNQLDPNTKITFPVNSTELAPANTTSEGLLVGIGGGKDSLVSIDLLRRAGLDTATWSLNHRPQLTSQVERIGGTHYWVERVWDKQILTLNAQGALNGHVPISAIFACVGTVVAILTGRRDTVVSNEQSANDPTLEYQGVAINHQYSKSQEFETSYQTLLAAHFGDSQRYYSLLRPLSELRIAELFAARCFDQYHDVFSSCNRAFTHDSTRLFWDGVCPKCCFVYLALAPFVSEDKLWAIFENNLLSDPSLEQTYRQLLGLQGDKPLECVGEIKECRAAMHLIQQSSPELEHTYQFELPKDYDFRELMPHSMPQDIWEVIRPFCQQ